jgi:tRNA-dihydrouridine synthase A
VALQLGGSDPGDLAACARLGERWGYAEINLNCGCPSERVQRGAFGACLMAEPALVADCVRAMRDAVAVPVTVKHRIGIDRIESYDFVRDFVGTVADGGCEVFIVHARNAWLHGISPKENRELPPLRHDVVVALKKDFPALAFVVNGGIRSDDEIEQHLGAVDGVMVGRAAYHQPWDLAGWDERFFAAPAPTLFARRRRGCDGRLHGAPGRGRRAVVARVAATSSAFATVSRGRGAGARSGRTRG